MQTIDKSPGSTPTIVESFLREAKRLQRAAQSDSLAHSLPVLRRLIARCVFRDLSLPALRRRQNLVQRKHTLQLLALEAGYSSWAECRQTLGRVSPETAEHYRMAMRQPGYPNHWFSTVHQAQAFASQYGGLPLAYGRQGVVIPADSCSA